MRSSCAPAPLRPPIRHGAPTLVARAREHYERAIALEPDLPESHAGLAATHLLDGERPPAGAGASAGTARNLLPGDAEIGMLEARIALRSGDRETARREAARSFSRARTRVGSHAAGSLLEQIDEHAAIR